jgi:hypothetical protein
MTKPFLDAEQRQDFIFGKVSEDMARASIARWDNRAQRIMRETLEQMEYAPEEIQRLSNQFVAVQRAQRAMTDSATLTAGQVVEKTIHYSKLIDAHQAAIVAALRYITLHELIMDAPRLTDSYDEETIGSLIETRMFFDNLETLLLDQLMIPDCDFDVQRAAGSAEAA